MLVLFLLPLLGVATLEPASAAEKTDSLRLESSVVAMGSAYSVAVYGDDRTRMEEAVDAAFEEVRRLDQMLSNYKPESELSELNRLAAERPVQVTPELFDLAFRVRGIQPRKRRCVRHHSRAVDEDLGIL